ncbi:MAG: FAD:protein FMN transferase [Moraxellaceae bacterium]|nr:FAD:protein FMN transferase [Moraxellaceae bacterium]MDZ4387802.1 FAD:protein FMN transferase [Moraxellaceae bacterium]
MQRHESVFQAMGGPCSVQICANDVVSANAALAAAEAEVRRIECKYSRYRDDSVVARINAAAGSGRAVSIDMETAQLLAIAERLYEQSDGRFDITSGVLRRVWNFQSAHPPPTTAVAEMLALIGWQHVHWSTEHVQLGLPGMELDFGGIGKEYAADRAAAVLMAHGTRHGFVELGGDISVVGPHPDGSPWLIGIHHPREPGKVLASIPLAQGGLATSGDYERCIVTPERRYSHILDARNGWPVDALASLTVVAPQCLLAGAACTLGMLQGQQAMNWLADSPYPWLAVTTELQLHGKLAVAMECAT